jgi:CPA1 family monovalent cation:H+ antiporter
LLPMLAALNLSPAMSRAYRIVILWGGLRGAVTLALALAVTENAGVPDDIKRFVAVLATGFVLFTLLVQGTTLKPLMRLLHLNRLGAVDQALREQALSVTHADARQAIEATAQSYALTPELAAEVASQYAAERPGERQVPEIGEPERLKLGLAALTVREQDLVLEHMENRTLSPDVVADLLAGTRRLLDAARLDGLDGYRREAEKVLAFGWKIRLGTALHSRLSLGKVLERRLSTRFEMLLVHRIVVHALLGFCDEQLKSLLGGEVAETARAALDERSEAAGRALDALRLQYPDYADALERRFLRLAALRREQDGYERLHKEGLIGPEVHRALLHELAVRTRAETRPKLDLKLDTNVLVRRVPLFQDFSDAELDDVCRLMRPAFAVPGQRLITKGERGDAAWFIASGAVEVDTGRERLRLGRGDFFGELALLTGLPRQADVTAIAYSDLLVLYARDFHAFVTRHPNVGAHIARVATERLGANRAAPAG